MLGGSEAAPIAAVGAAQGSAAGPAAVEQGVPGVEARRPASVKPPGREACGEGRGGSVGKAPQHMLLTFASGVMQLGNSIRERGWGMSLFPGRWCRGLAGAVHRAPPQAKVERDGSGLSPGQPNFCSLILLGRRVPSIRRSSPPGSEWGQAACPPGHRCARPGALEHQIPPVKK